MAHLSISFCRQLARARRDKGLTQSMLAQTVGCKQSAISMLESGQSEKLSQETVEKIAALLGVPVESPAPHSMPAAASGAFGYCPNADCYSNVPYVVQNELFFWPRLHSLALGNRCVFCGELLESTCHQCGAPVAEGACCSTCGTPRVTNTIAADVPAETWAAKRRRDIAEWKALLS